MSKTARETFVAEHIIARILAGDKQAFGRLIEKYEKLVSHLVFRMISHEIDREELCQEIFIKVYRNLASFKFQSKLSTWIGRIAYNSCLNFLKKKRVPLQEDMQAQQTNEPDFVASEATLSYFANFSGQEPPTPEQELASRDLQAVLNREIARLPVQYRALITLFHVDELSLKEIAEIMQMPEGTVKNYLFRARKILKNRLMQKYQHEDLWS